MTRPNIFGEKREEADRTLTSMDLHVRRRRTWKKKGPEKDLNDCSYAFQECKVSAMDRFKNLNTGMLMNGACDSDLAWSASNPTSHVRNED